MRTIVIAGLLLVAATALGAPPGEAIWIGASISSRAEFSEGAKGDLELHLEIPEAWSASAAGIPQPILQIQVPDSISLDGEHLTEFRELARNEFLEEPFERTIEPGDVIIPFTMAESPADGETIALNVIAYVTTGEEGESYFVRRRIELPLEAGAEARSGEQASVSDWGVNGTLEIGDRAVAYELPRAGGEVVAMNEAIGTSNVIVTTYRAFW